MGLRALNAPRPVTVEADDGAPPGAVVLEGRRRPVIAVRDEWLVQDRWWTDRPVDRHYFELVLDPGRVAVVFHDIRAGRWFAHLS
ncbi:MAG TPA: hypothetical protein VHK23_07640 [Miltoncostaeaceae bacterium]|jgi:hypothetical protein|nr:hypothetical protein [Miltoncostaeaceae bacterium]